MVQLCFEAFLYAGAVSFAKHVEYARYSRVPIGNLGPDAIVTSYDVMFARILQKNRALLWASRKAGTPNVGIGTLSLVPVATMMGVVMGFALASIAAIFFLILDQILRFFLNLVLTINF